MRSHQVEQWLVDENGVEFRYRVSVPLGEIDREKSLDNQARLNQSIVPSLVDGFVYRIGQRWPNPALVAWTDPPSNKLVLIDGNNRLAALVKTATPTTDVYVVETQDRGLIEHLTFTANINNGLKPTPEANLAHTTNAVLKHGHSQKRAAADYGVQEMELSKELVRIATRKRLDALDVNASKLTDWTIKRLGSLHFDAVLKAAAVLSAEARLTPGQVDEMIRDARASRSEVEELGAIAAYRGRPDILLRIAKSRRGVHGLAVTPGSRLFGYMSSIQGLLGRHPTLTSMGLAGPNDRSRVSDQFLAVNDAMRAWLTRQLEDA